MIRLLRFLSALALLVTLSGPTLARAQSNPSAVVEQAARVHGVSPSFLVALGACESGLDATAVGDHGTSFGLFQLHDGGLLGDFYAEGYTDPLNAWQSSDFAAGYIAANGAGAWSCSYVLDGTTPPWWG